MTDITSGSDHNWRKARVEGEADSANRILEVWDWLTHGKRRLESAGKSAEEIAETTAKFEKAYKTLQPQMERVMDYLSRWFF